MAPRRPLIPGRRGNESRAIGFRAWIPENRTNSSRGDSMSRKNVSWSMLLVLIGGASLVTPASAQHFQQVKGTLASVSAGRNEVFGFNAHGAVLRYYATAAAFGKIAGVSLDQVSVGGGTVSQLDEVWGLDAGFNVYQFNYSTKAFAQIPGASLVQIAVGEGVQDS